MTRFRESDWRKSTRSIGNGDCVEVAVGTTTVGIRDSKNPQGGVVEVDREVFTRFVASVKRGELDFPLTA